ncbi:glycine zipper 2TM domain-containing protein [Accumulibacter sp.]|uniref:glycine zipper 2TM domain-containing protein n=1 Tax=Accumulibacter sp. TaxID=2053492 RepID=UPI0028C4DD3C|nr:glycine zipper 2TM domain-containing protein [Accumulibacter sp.]
MANTPQQDSGIAVESRSKDVYRNCGTIESVREIKQDGEGSGIGAVARGVIGGLLGNQIGGGRGRSVATVAGVVGGAYAGHEVEKKTRGTQQYQITVRLDDDKVQTFTETQAPVWRAGDRVRISNGQITGM